MNRDRNNPHHHLQVKSTSSLPSSSSDSTTKRPSVLKRLLLRWGMKSTPAPVIPNNSSKTFESKSTSASSSPQKPDSGVDSDPPTPKTPRRFREMFTQTTPNFSVPTDRYSMYKSHTIGYSGFRRGLVPSSSSSISPSCRSSCRFCPPSPSPYINCVTSSNRMLASSGATVRRESFQHRQIASYDPHTNHSATHNHVSGHSLCCNTCCPLFLPPVPHCSSTSSSSHATSQCTSPPLIQKYNQEVTRTVHHHSNPHPHATCCCCGCCTCSSCSWR